MRCSHFTWPPKEVFNTRILYRFLVSALTHLKNSQIRILAVYRFSPGVYAVRNIHMTVLQKQLYLQALACSFQGNVASWLDSRGKQA